MNNEKDIEKPEDVKDNEIDDVFEKGKDGEKVVQLVWNNETVQVTLYFY